MPETTNEDRHLKIERVYLHLRKFSDGLRESEIAQHLNLNRRMVNEYLHVLDVQGRIYKESVRWYVDRDYVPLTIRPISLEADEAMVLYLASRLFVKASDTRNTAAEIVLEKLAHILRADADVSEDIAQAAMQLAQRQRDENYQDIFRKIMRGYLHRCPAEIIYHPYKGDPFVTTIHPYLLEPSAIGFATYVIGYSSRPHALRTYKIGRITRAKLLHTERYTIPDDFPGLAILDNAWSIYYGEDTLDVTLRFHPDVARRVRETHWHPSQQSVEDDPEKAGYVLLHFTVADTTDLIPWIRTWGANCEVLEPHSLRDRLIGEARRFAELYGWVTNRTAVEADEDDPFGLDSTLSDFFG